MSNPSPPKKRKTNDTEAPSTIKPSPAKVTEQPSKTNLEEPEDWTSSSGGDSDSDSDSDSASITIPTKPPQSTTPTTISNTNTNTIHTRLTSFFSQLAEQRANPDTVDDQSIEKVEIDSESDSGFEDEGGDGRGQYIEMDLALGVLSEKGSDDEEENGGIKVRVPGREEDGDSEESVDGGQDGDGQGVGGLDGLTDIAAGSGTRKRKGKKKGEEKRKIQEVE